MTEPLIWREPSIFPIGDSLMFQRSLPDYLPSDGWSITYAVTPETDGGASPALTFNSTPDSTNKYHVVSIQNFGSGLKPGPYVFSGYLVNTNGERHQIYYGELVLTDNLPAGSTSSHKSFYEEMVEIQKEKVKHLERQILQESDVQRTRFVIEERDKALERLGFYEERVNYERKMRVIQNTGRNPDRIAPVYAGDW